MIDSTQIFLLGFLAGEIFGCSITIYLLRREKRKFMKAIAIPDDFYRETLAEKRP